MDRESTPESPSPARRPSREAAVVILYRRAPQLEVFRVRRAEKLAYLGGFHAFPGGAVHASDLAVPFAGDLPAAERARRVSAARELFEEVGVLLGLPSGGPADELSPTERTALRAAVDRGDRSFAEVLASQRRALLADTFTPAGRWISPPFLPRAFDTYFYLVELPAGEEPGPLSGELDAGEWIRPARGLQEWHARASLLATPVRRSLEILAAAEDDAAVAWGQAMAESPEAQGGAVERIEVTPGAVLIPVRTPTLAPATHTNCLVLGEGECLLVDFGSEEEAEFESLDRVLGRLAEDGRRVTAIALTHHHQDHVGGVQALRRRLGVPVLAHPLLAGRVGADRALVDGEFLELASANSPPWRVQARFTPGHTRDHVAYWEDSRGVLVAGDLLSGVSTVVIDPPDGHLGEYLASLEALRALPVRVLFPGHGPPTGGGIVKIGELLAHRRWREERVLGSLRPEPQPIDELVPSVYEDVKPEMWGLAERSLLAHLLHLEETGSAVRTENDGRSLWSRPPTS